MRKLTSFVALLSILGTAACTDSSEAPLEPEADREVQIAGMTGAVFARYDAVGMLSLDCETDLDCLAAEGYFHAQDRFFQMDLRRRLSLGTLSEVVGDVTLPIDHQQRTKLSTRDGRHIAEQFQDNLTSEMTEALEAYARGVNAWLGDVRDGRNGARLPDEYAFLNIDLSLLKDWTPLDSIACFMPIIDRLTNDSPKDLLSGEAIAALGADVGSDLFGVRVVSTSSTLTPSVAGPVTSPPQRDMNRWLKVIRSAREVAGEDAETTIAQGSNNWIVGPSKGGGKSFLANDPHLTLSNPAIWYMVHIDAKTHGGGQLHLAGASFPGLPGILLGHNDDVAWGATTTRFDQADVYMETLNAAGDAVVFNGNEVPLVSVPQTYQVRNQEAQTLPVQIAPHHGPLLSVDAEAGTAMSLRWVAQDADTDFNFLWKIWTSSTREEVQTALREVTTVGQNFVVADVQGELGWYPYNRLPDRPWMSTHPTWYPLPGDGSAEWGDYLPYEELPQATNPALGYLATANNDMTGHLYDGDPSNDGQRAIQNHAWAGYRHERIMEMLGEKETLDLDDMHRVLHDTKSLFGAYVVPKVISDLEGVELTGAVAEVADALRNWDYFCPSGFDNHDPSAPVPSDDPEVVASSRGCLAFHVLWSRLKLATFGDELAAAELTPKDDPLAIAFLRPEVMAQDYFDDISTTEVTETRADIVRVALEEAAAYIVEQLGSDAAEWRWGALHQLYMPADLFDDAGITDFAHGPVINKGGLGTVNWAPPHRDIDHDYQYRLGPSFRLACEIDGTISCTYQLPGGQKHLQDDPAFLGLLDDYLAERPRPLPFTREQVTSSTIETIAVR